MPGPYEVFNTSEYWAGTTGYRRDSSGVGYRDFSQVNEPLAEYIVSKKPQRVLDIGAGGGYLVGRLRQWGIDAWGIDVSRYAIENFAPPEVRPHLVVGSATHLPWSDKDFDISVSVGVLEHLLPEDVDKAIAAIVRVSKAGCHFIGLSTEYGMNLPPESQDQTHRTKKPYDWWKSKFPPNYPLELFEGAQETIWHINRFRVLVVAPTNYPVGGAGYGGIERLAFLLSKELARRGIDTTLASASDSRVPWGVKFLDCGSANPTDYEGTMAWCLLQPHAQDYSVILDLSHGHWTGKLLPWHTRQLSVIWHAPVLMPTLPEPQYNVTALSQYQADTYFYATGRRARVMDIHMLDDITVEGELGDRFLVVGRLTRRKGVLEAIRLCRGMDVGLDIVGPLGEDPTYNQAVKTACDGAQVVWWGELPHSTLLGLASRARALLYPRQEDEAHLGHKSVDVLGCGCPVIVADSPACREVMEEGVDGFLCHTPEEFNEAMGRVVQLDREKIRERAWARWGPDAVMERLTPILVEASRGARW